MSDSSDVDNQYQKSQKQLVQQYWNRWVRWINDVKKQRFQAMKVYRFQNQTEQKRIKSAFQKWKQFCEQEKMNKIKEMRNCQIERKEEAAQRNNQSEQRQQKDQYQQNQEQDESRIDIHKLCYAIQYQKTKLTTKAFCAWIKYFILCKKFQRKISLFYARYLLKKYFNIISEFKTLSRQQKLQKTQTLAYQSIQTSRLEQQFYNQESNFSIANSSLNNFHRNIHNQTNQTFLQRNPTQKKRQTQQVNNTMIQFSKNKLMAQSRRSQFSTTSAQFEYQSKRRFRPITQIPSLPKFDNVVPKNLQGSNYSNQDRPQPRSPIKKYQQSRIQQLVQQQAENLSNTYQKQNSQTIKKNKILEMIVKQKLITLEIMKGQEFNNKQEGMEYQNYREKTVNMLRKIKEIKIS